MSKSPVFPQLDRLAEYERRERPTPGRPQRETPLDEIFAPDGVAPGKDDDDET